MSLRDEAVMIGILGDVLGGKSIGQAIEDHGRYEQQSLARKSETARLPKEIRHGTQVDLERWGVEILGEVDDLFLNVSLPTGWEVRPTDHYMWNELRDSLGRLRASFFFKPEFYDRDAFMSLRNRYACDTEHDYHSADENEPYIPLVKDADGSVIWRGEPCHPSPEDSYDSTPRGRALTAARVWLDENRPGWDDLHAYW